MLIPVIPAKAGIQLPLHDPGHTKESWIPAFAGMTMRSEVAR